ESKRVCRCKIDAAGIPRGTNGGGRKGSRLWKRWKGHYLDVTVPTIVTIGKATQDVFLKSAKAFAQFEHKGVKYERLPVGKKLDLDEVTFATGGNVTNAAVTFARQGLDSRYAWCLGVGPESEMILSELDKEGVNTAHVHQSERFHSS